MSSPGLLCLKWNNHTSAFDKLLNNLHLRDMYSDGTIVCHGKFYPVHRFVLSTCSEYFEEIFHQSIHLKSKHPFIIVKDIHPPQMEALLNYMYRGEVNVPQEMLPELIKAAEAFKIKGLAVPDDEPPLSKSSSSRDRKRSSANLSSPSSQVKKSKRMDDNSKRAKISSISDDEIKDCEEIQTECNSGRIPENYSPGSKQKNEEELFTCEIPLSIDKSEPPDLPEYNKIEEIPKHSPAEDYLSPKELGIKDEKSFESYTIAEPVPPYKDDENFASNSQYDLAQSLSWEDSQDFDGDNNLEENDSAQRVGNMDLRRMRSSSDEKDCDFFGSSVTLPYRQMFMCTICSYQSTHNQNVQRHIKKHTGEKPFKCDQCPYKSAQKENLRRHLLIHSGEKPFSCPKCQYKSTQKHALVAHMSRHEASMGYNS